MPLLPVDALLGFVTRRTTCLLEAVAPVLEVIDTLLVPLPSDAASLTAFAAASQPLTVFRNVTRFLPALEIHGCT